MPGTAAPSWWCWTTPAYAGADTVRWAELAPLAETGHVAVTTRNRALLEMAS